MPKEINMLTAKTIMNQNPESCLLDTPIKDIMNQFATKHTDYILVLDGEQRLQGMITESDLIEQQANLHIPTAFAVFDMVIPVGEEKFEREIKRLEALTARGLMTTDLTTVSPDTPIHDLATLMSETKVYHLPVISKGSVKGLVGKHDVIKALASL